MDERIEAEAHLDNEIVAMMNLLAQCRSIPTNEFAEQCADYMANVKRAKVALDIVKRRPSTNTSQPATDEFPVVNFLPRSSSRLSNFLAAILSLASGEDPLRFDLTRKAFLVDNFQSTHGVSGTPTLSFDLREPILRNAFLGEIEAAIGKLRSFKPELLVLRRKSCGSIVTLLQSLSSDLEQDGLFGSLTLSYGKQLFARLQISQPLDIIDLSHPVMFAGFVNEIRTRLAEYSKGALIFDYSALRSPGLGDVIR